MVTQAVTIKFKILESELQALLVEAELIRTYQPEFNTLLRDDKSPLYIEITNEQFPKVLKTRKKDFIKNKKQGELLGPFPSAYKTNEVLKISRRIFPWCNREHTPCFYYHLDQCPGVCTKEISENEYRQNIENLKTFLTGKSKTVTRLLKQKLEGKISVQAFEEAAVIRDQLKIIEEVTSPTHKLKPDLTNTVLQNNVSEDGIIYLQKILSQYLGFPKQFPLSRIEGYDVSNIQGTSPAVSLVCFTDGRSDTTNYKVFNIKTLNTPNDYYMLQEALIRRQNHKEWGTPNLILIDGGKGQVKSVLKIWKWSVPVIGIAKHPDRLVLPYYETDSKNGKKSLKYHLVKLENNHPTLKLIQQIRNESHRFAQKQHKKKRLQKMFE